MKPSDNRKTVKIIDEINSLEDLNEKLMIENRKLRNENESFYNEKIENAMQKIDLSNVPKEIKPLVFDEIKKDLKDLKLRKNDKGELIDKSGLFATYQDKIFNSIESLAIAKAKNFNKTTNESDMKAKFIEGSNLSDSAKRIIETAKEKSKIVKNRKIAIDEKNLSKSAASIFAAAKKGS